MDEDFVEHSSRKGSRIAPFYLWNSPLRVHKYPSLKTFRTKKQKGNLLCRRKPGLIINCKTFSFSFHFLWPIVSPTLAAVNTAASNAHRLYQAGFHRAIPADNWRHFRFWWQKPGYSFLVLMLWPVSFNSHLKLCRFFLAYRNTINPYLSILWAKNLQQVKSVCRYSSEIINYI